VTLSALLAVVVPVTVASQQQVTAYSFEPKHSTQVDEYINSLQQSAMGNGLLDTTDPLVRDGPNFTNQDWQHYLGSLNGSMIMTGSERK
jgi:hypothetical protein